MVQLSPWPLTTSCSLLLLVWGLVRFFHGKTMIQLFVGIFLVSLSCFLWWRDTSREGGLLGDHSFLISEGLRWGMVLFIVSEVFFFLAFFWSWFDFSLTPLSSVSSWPPAGVMPLNPLEVPLLNTTILVSSGVSVTWAHHEALEGYYLSYLVGMILTILLGFYFTLLQGMEYLETEFSISDSSYGSIFFMGTGFHGTHVLVGTLLLFITTVRFFKMLCSKDHMFGFEAAAWYWHFVDVVWLFLFSFIYWWGNVFPSS